MPELFDGASFLVRGELRDLIREQLGPAQPEAEVEVAVGGEQERQMQRDEGEGPTPPPARPLPVKRYMRVRLTVPAMPVVKIPNLQPYLWKVLQEADAGSTLAISVDVECPAGLSEDVLEKRIVEGFDQLGITVTWQSGSA